MIFVDSSAWFALVFAGDKHHTRAATLLTTAAAPLVTSDHVLIETWLLVNSRFNYHHAQVFWKAWLESGVHVEIAMAQDLASAATIATRFADQTFSIVDRTSFALMERLGIDKAVSFDDDFVVCRYGTDRTKAFEVLR